MLPAPRVVVIDDNPLHLAGLIDALNRCGAACMPVHFTGSTEGFGPCQHVRVIFADLHLDDSGAADDHTRHFAVIGGLLQETIVPRGPYILVLWTMYADQASSLHAFLEQRLEEVPAPYLTVSLNKADHLDSEGKVVDAAALMSAIRQAVSMEPQVAALLNWEERVLSAAAETVSSIVTLGPATATDRRTRLRQLLYHLAAGSVGSMYVFTDRFRAVNEALLPILADRISALRGTADPSWDAAFDATDAMSGLSAEDAARLNTFSHIVERDGGAISENDISSGEERGAVVQLPAFLSGDHFGRHFGIPQADAATQQLRCKDYAPTDPRFGWVLVQIQAACDYAQRQPGPLPFALGMEMPETALNGNRPPAALWRSPPLHERRDRPTAGGQLSVHRFHRASDHVGAEAPLSHPRSASRGTDISLPQLRGSSGTNCLPSGEYLAATLTIFCACVRARRRVKVGIGKGEAELGGDVAELCHRRRLDRIERDGSLPGPHRYPGEDPTTARPRKPADDPVAFRVLRCKPGRAKGGRGQHARYDAVSHCGSRGADRGDQATHR
jgi:hypothetical protein